MIMKILVTEKAEVT